MSRKLKLLSKFSKLTTQFLDELIEQFPHEPELVVARVMINGQIPVEDVIKEFMNRILPHEKHVKERNEKFFLEEMKLFSGIKGVDQSQVVKFKKLWTSDLLDKEDREVIWNWFDIFVKIIKEYKKEIS